VGVLLAAGADATAVSSADGGTLLHSAAAAPDEGTVSALLSAGCDASLRNRAGQLPAEVASAEGGGDAARALLLAAQRAQEALEACARGGDCAGVRAALAAGALMHHRGAQGDTALTLAAKAGSEDTLKVLIQAGALIGAADALGLTALHCAAGRGANAALTLLLQSGADVSALDTASNTALRHAAVGGHSACVNALLNAGSPVDRATYSAAKDPTCRYMLLEAVETQLDGQARCDAEKAVEAIKAAKVNEKMASSWC
jgi:ankyrin repeat protein